MAPSSVALPGLAPLPQGYRLRQKSSTSALGQWPRLLRFVALERTASLGLFVVLLVGLGLGGMAVVEGLRLVGAAQGATLDLVSGLALGLLLLILALLVVALVLSLRSLSPPALHAPRPPRRQKQTWELCQGKAVVARLELSGPFPPGSDDGLQLRRLRLGKRYRRQGLGRQFVWAVLAQTPQHCYVQVPQSRHQAAQVAFFQSCGFVLGEAPVPLGRSRRRPAPSTWLCQAPEDKTQPPQ